MDTNRNLNRTFGNGRLRKEPQWPKCITKLYAFKLLHGARIRVHFDKTLDAQLKAEVYNILTALYHAETK